MHVETDTMAAVANGDKNTLSDMYEELAPTIYGLALRVTESKKKAVTVVEETFKRFRRMAHKMEEIPGGYFLWTVNEAKNVALNHESRSDQFDFFAYQRSNYAGHNLFDVLSKIDRKHQQVLELSFFRKLSEEQIEEEMNIPVGTVATRLRLAIKAMRKVVG